MTRMFLAVLVALLCILPNSAFGADVAGVHFADQITVGSSTLALNGVGVRRVTIFQVKVYVAGLYLAQPTRDAAEVLRTDRPKYYLAVMKRDVSRDDTAPVFRAGIERSAGADLGAIRLEIAAFEQWVPSMSSGQALSVAFTPDSGVIVKSTARSEAFQGSVKFGTALFGMWVGPTATDTDLRAALLSGHPGSGS